MTDAPKISDAEATAVYKRVLLADDEQDLKPNRKDLEAVRQALAAFLKGRLPEKMCDIFGDGDEDLHMGEVQGFNACRDIVWSGRKG